MPLDYTVFTTKMNGVRNVVIMIKMWLFSKVAKNLHFTPIFWTEKSHILVTMMIYF